MYGGVRCEGRLPQQHSNINKPSNLLFLVKTAYKPILVALLSPFIWVSSSWADTPAEALDKAAKKLAEGSYSWTNSTEWPSRDDQRRATTTEGKTDGKVTMTSTKMGDREVVTFRKGEATVFKFGEEWTTPEQMQARPAEGTSNGGGRGGRGFGGRPIQTPSEEVVKLAKGAKSLTEADGALSGELTEEAAKESTMRFRTRGGQEPPAAKDLKVAVKFWLKDGAISKYEVATSGKTEWNGEERALDSKRAVELKEVGSTKIEVPEAVQKLLEKAPAVKPEEKKPAEEKPVEEKKEPEAKVEDKKP